MWRLLSDKSHLCVNIGTPCRVRNSMDQASEKNKVSRWTKWVFGTFKNVAHVLKTVIKRYFLLKKKNQQNHLFPSFLKPDHVHNSSNYATHLPISMKINITYLLVLLWNIHHNPLVNTWFSMNSTIIIL